MRGLSNREISEVTLCTRCKAAPGSPCTTKAGESYGYGGYIHAARERLVWKAWKLGAGVDVSD